MTFSGVKDPHQRVDLLAFLKDVTKPGAKMAQDPQSGMGGMMGGGQAQNLRKLDDEDRVQSVPNAKIPTP
jgi:cytochrome c